MRWLARTRLLLWLALVTTVPPAMLDLTNSTFAPLTILAGALGLPYYAVQSVLPLQRSGTSASPAEIVLSAVLGMVPFVLAHLLLRRRDGRSASSGAPAA